MDRRKARTEKAVQTAFCSLLETKRYSQITVQDVLDEADIGRSTFYTHYRGKEDLLARLVDEICAHATSPVAPEKEHDFTEHTDDVSVVEHLLRHVQERKSGVRALIVSEGAGSFERLLRESLTQQADRALPAELDGAAGSVDRRFLVEHIAGSLVDMIVRWARTAFTADPRLLAESYIALTKPLFG